MAQKNRTRSWRERARQRRRRQQRVQMALMIIGGLLLLGSAYLMVRGRSVRADVEVHPEDVVYGEPLHAIHEMTGPTLDQIPFLPKDGPQPVAAAPEDFYDFGVVGPTDVVQHKFYLVNTGEAPLTISRAYTTCGCTTADISATVIPPGKAAEIVVTFDAGYHDVRGQTVRRGVIIENNDPKHPQVEFWIQATVRR